MPEVEALCRFLDEKTRGMSVERCELASFAALKTFDPPLSDVTGREVRLVERRGKYVCWDLSGLWLVVHLARGGWIRWSDLVAKARARPGRSPLALRLGFSDGSGVDVTEMGTEKRLALWVVHDPGDVEGVGSLGPDPLQEGFTPELLADLLRGQSGTVKNALTRQSVIAGVGNAYSDEALHSARISPFKPAAKLDEDELHRLHRALVDILTDATDRASGLAAAELKGDKKRAMRVHGRTGEKCPTCGDTIREVSFATKSLQYCPTCQTGGKPLADRRLSRLLK
jgi:formamidopyrimidine-DNA glycosylase